MISRIVATTISLVIVAMALNFAWAAGGTGVNLEPAPIDISDYASLQRGAKLFVNYCQSCHSMKFMRYDSLAQGIAITNEDDEILEAVVKDNLQFVGKKLSATMATAMQEDDAKKWFGTLPPDLSLVARSRGVDWLYGYLRGFYIDLKRPWGVNNLVFPEVGMPHVLVNLQGKQLPIYNEQEEVIGVELAENGSMQPGEFDAAMADLVNFMAFVGEPMQLKRKHLGGWVLVFLGIFLVFSYLLKREYWKK